MPTDNTLMKVDDELGVVFGWAIVCTKDGEPYYDLHNDHIPEDAMVKAVDDFMSRSQKAKEMHQGGVMGRTTLFPVTTELAKSFGFDSNMTGALVMWKPDNKEVCKKFKDGTYTGFSIGGGYIENEDTILSKLSNVETEAKKFVKLCGFFDKNNPNAVKNKHRQRIMREFFIDEVSGVGKGAQEPALATMVKRGDNGEVVEKVMLLTTLNDKHQHSVDIDTYDLKRGGGSTSYNGNGDNDGHSHPYVFLPDGSIMLGESNGHTHDADGSGFFTMFSMQQALAKRAKYNEKGEEEDDEDNDVVPKKGAKKKDQKKKPPVKKSVTDDGYTAQDYALVGDANDCETFKYRLARRPGDGPDRRLVGNAITELRKHAGTLGTERATVIRRVRNAWIETHTHRDPSEMPSVLKQATL